MEDNFRNTLIIISAVVIGAIFVHGLWTIRKNKNPYKLKTGKDKVSPQERDFDRGGFDQDGVSKVKVKAQMKEENTPSLNESIGQASFEQKLAEQKPTECELAQPLNTEEPTPEFKLSTDDATTLLFTDTDSKKAVESPLPINTELEAEVMPVVETQKVVPDEVVEQKKQEPLYQEPVIQPKSQVKPKENKAKSAANKAALKRNQMEINFGNALDIDDEPMQSISVDNSSSDLKESKSKPQDKKIVQPAIQPEVLALSVVMPQSQIISGANLLPSLLTLGLKYGEMNIFHRHQDNAGNGSVTFSLANMMNPGSFELDSMETFVTQGVTLFMMLPNAGNAFEVYEQMLAAAKQLAQEFQAQVLDDKRNVMTKQTEQHYVSRIRAFEIKHRTAMA